MLDITHTHYKVKFTCDGKHWLKKTFTAFGESLGACKKRARAQGWVLHDNNTCSCSQCSGVMATRTRKKGVEHASS
jgi:hypothetical protein